MIERTLGPRLADLARWFSVVSLTGLRQSGKSTLVRHVFADYAYVTLEDPANRARALADPTGFVEDLPERTVIDEAQYAPELFAAIQARAGERATMGQYVLTGSQNFLLLNRIKESLAGRVGIAKLLPLTYAEILAADPGAVERSTAELMVRGAYPALYASDVPARVFYQNYLETYLARDVADYLGVRNLTSFRAFLSACAARAGSLLNLSDLARECGVSVPTVRSWLSILESSYVVRLLRPLAANVSKRLAKRPKLSFLDTRLLCHLLGVASADDLGTSEHLGPVFENYVLAERVKADRNRLEEPRLSFYRDESKTEVDLIEQTPGERAFAAAIKSSRTWRPTFARVVRRVAPILGLEPMVVYGGRGTFDDDGAQVYGIREWRTRERRRTGRRPKPPRASAAGGPADGRYTPAQPADRPTAAAATRQRSRRTPDRRTVPIVSAGCLTPPSCRVAPSAVARSGFGRKCVVACCRFLSRSAFGRGT